jgi:hypothetical protein
LAEKTRRHPDHNTRARPPLAAPYYVFKDAGAQITLASPKGGRPPLDPKSNEPNFQTDITRRFEKDADAEAQLGRTVRLDSVKKITIPSFTRADTAPCGTWPKIRIQSS